jgi:hypothetical protein
MENQPTAIVGDALSDAHPDALVICYGVLLFLCLVALLASVPILLVARARRPRQMSWWLVVVLSAASGWIASNGFAYLDAKAIEAAREEALRHGYLAHYWAPAPLSLTLPWGWIIGVVYLLVCLAPYPMFLANEGHSASRLFKGLAIVAAGLLVAAWLPPWADTDLLRAGLLGYFCALVLFVLCAGVSERVLRAFHLHAPGWAFLVMFSASLLIRLALRAASDALDRVVMIWPFVSRSIWYVEWAALFGGLFTAFWWIAIRRRPVSPSQLPGRP